MDNKKNSAQENININLDTTPVLYTDRIQMTTNEDGVVLDVTQRVMNTNQLRVVARIGMSRVHAQKLADELSKLLALTQGQSQTQGKKKN